MDLGQRKRLISNGRGHEGSKREEHEEKVSAAGRVELELERTESGVNVKSGRLQPPRMLKGLWNK